MNLILGTLFVKSFVANRNASSNRGRQRHHGTQHFVPYVAGDHRLSRRFQGQTTQKSRWSLSKFVGHQRKSVAKRKSCFNWVFFETYILRKVLQDYALVVYKNENLEEIGLSGLTKILKGGVRVSNNKKLCYAETVDWEDIIDDASAKKSGILVSANMDENFCADVCPNHCSKMKNGKASCWNSRECQRKQVSKLKSHN